MKVLVTAEFTPEGLRELTALGLSPIYDPWTRRDQMLLADELAERIKQTGAEALILEIDLCHQEVFEAADLKFIGCCRCDPLIVDLDEATDRGVPVFYTPGRNAEAVADLTLAMMLDLLRGVSAAAADLRSGAFNPETPADYMAELRRRRGRELGSLTVGLVGLGAVGAAVARRLRGFGCRLLAADPFAPDRRFADLGAEKAGLPELFRRADVVSLHAAESDENQGLIGRELIAAMKPEAIFLNLARAALVDNDALYEALAAGRIAAAGLDVFRREPPGADDRFVALPNVLALPHLGGATREVVQHQTDILLADLKEYFRGGNPRHLANPEVLARRRF